MAVPCAHPWVIPACTRGGDPHPGCTEDVPWSQRSPQFHCPATSSSRPQGSSSRGLDIPFWLLLSPGLSQGPSLRVGVFSG